jgi:nicotinate-nucleotide adenylyltransferase
VADVRVGVFGGSFDPPHLAHVLAVESVLATGQVDRVLVLPVHGHAFGKRMEAFEHRVRMCELAFDHIANAEVSELERELPPPNYTLHTLEALRLRHPAAELRLIVGGDVLRDHGKWYRWDEVTRLAPVVALGRVGVPVLDAPPAVLPDVSSTEVRTWLARRGSAVVGAAGVPTTSVSAGSPEPPRDAEARRRLAEVVPRKVLDYIDEHDLYR